MRLGDCFAATGQNAWSVLPPFERRSACGLAVGHCFVKKKKLNTSWVGCSLKRSELCEAF